MVYFTKKLYYIPSIDITSSTAWNFQLDGQIEYVTLLEMIHTCWKSIYSIEDRLFNQELSGREMNISQK